MTKSMRLVGAALVTVLAALAAAPVALAEERACQASLGAITVDNLVVPDGASCSLTGTRVEGTLRVGTGSTLVASGISVKGNLQAEGAARVVVRSSTVGGSIQVKQGRAATIARNTVNADVQVTANRGATSVSLNRIGGNLQCKENDPAPTGGGNIVNGNKEDQCAAL
jgi:hypothetical protein